MPFRLFGDQQTIKQTVWWQLTRLWYINHFKRIGRGWPEIGSRDGLSRILCDNGTCHQVAAYEVWNDQPHDRNDVEWPAVRDCAANESSLNLFTCTLIHCVRLRAETASRTAGALRFLDQMIRKQTIASRKRKQLRTIKHYSAENW